MLKGLDPLLGPDLLHALASMGHGDELVVADCDLGLTRFGKETVFDFARHHRVEHYGRITSQTGVVPPPEE